MSGQLKEVRERISSVISTQQITKAMKMVSASKLRKAQQAITEMRPYADRLNHILKNILSNIDGDASSSYGVEREIEKVLIVVITSSKGLAGAFNSNIIKAAENNVRENYQTQLDNGNLKFFCVGKKGFEHFKKYYGADKVNGEHADLFAHLSYEDISAISQELMDYFTDGEYDRIDVCYGKFKNAALQEPQTVQYLPVEKVEVTPKNHKEHMVRADYIFEPSKEELLEQLIPTILQTTFQKFVLDNHASEHGARMTAMDAATENANELLKDLKISYNKARQAAITTELSEIVSGAAALNG